MSLLNFKACNLAGGNTGSGDCFIEPKNLAGGFLVPSGFELTAEQMASPESTLAALVAAANNDNPALRIYPLPEIVALTDNSEDPVFETLGYGVPVPVREGNYNWQARFTRGGVCTLKQLQKFNGSGKKVMVFDAEGLLIATKVGTSAKGIPLHYFYADKWKVNDGTANLQLFYRLSFNPSYINQNIGFVELDYGSLADITGLQNINITLAAPRAANVITVKVTTGCSGLDLYDQYSTELAAVGNFIVTEGGSGITITSVAVDANLKAFTITLDAADPDYDSAGPFVVSLAAVSVLTAAGIVGFEGLSLTVA